MKSLYITSVERYSGKTATCLAIGKRLIADGFRVGYLKPLSLQPWRIAGRIADEDTAFVKETLGLQQPAWELSPVVVTPELLRERLRSQNGTDLIERVKSACQNAAEGKDVLLLEGGASLREGYAVGLPTPAVAAALDSQVLVIVRYRDEVQVLDDVLAAHQRLGPALKGVLINRARPEARPFLQEVAAAFIESRGIPVFGILPETHGLAALTVQELIKVLNAQVLTKEIKPEALVETLTVGAMTAEAALSRFRQQTNKAVITGGDRTDIQLAALETSTTCLVLTGNLHPSPLIVKQAEEFGVAVLLVPGNTMETVEAIERIFGKTRLGQPSKLHTFETLLSEHFDLERLYAALGLKT